MDTGLLDTGGVVILPVFFPVLNKIYQKLALQQKRFAGPDTAAGKNYKRENGIVINIKDPLAADKFVNTLQSLLKHKAACPGRPIIILCIGSDRCTGDCLGPLIGSRLEETKSGNYIVYGTLQKPVHARNLENCLLEIRSSYPKPFIIAIDASLGHSQKDTGTITINKGPLRPGNGVHKALPAVGDLSISAIVNDFPNLYSTRLYSVIKLAGFIATGIQQVFSQQEENERDNIPKIS